MSRLNILKKISVKEKDGDTTYIIAFHKDDIKNGNSAATKILPNQIFKVFAELEVLVCENIGGVFTSLQVKYLPEVPSQLNYEISAKLVSDNSYVLEMPADGFEVVIETRSSEKGSDECVKKIKYTTQAFANDLHLFTADTATKVSEGMTKIRFLTLLHQCILKLDKELYEDKTWLIGGTGNYSQTIESQLYLEA